MTASGGGVFLFEESDRRAGRLVWISINLLPP